MSTASNVSLTQTSSGVSSAQARQCKLGLYLPAGSSSPLFF